jgi:hypothetical protein
MRQHLIWGPSKLFVTDYVSSGRLVNRVGFASSDGWREESWSARGDRAEALSLLADFDRQQHALHDGRSVSAARTSDVTRRSHLTGR